mmetsp:Transcript_1078/g.4091  ORF Transcript_1078/g.4091 Transcript_1078/m.4091 type:complete len:82 (+) Transcript_1078:732-977(+)
MQWLAAATAMMCHHPCQTANAGKSFRRMASLLLYRQNRGGAARKTCAGDSAEWANRIMNTVMPDAYHRSMPCHTLFLPVIT